MPNPPQTPTVERASAAERVLERVRELELEVASVSDLVLVVDETYRVVECNGASEAIWGIRRAELLGRLLPVLGGLLTLVDSDGAAIAPHNAPTARAIATGLPQVEPLVGVRRSDGSVSWARVVAIPLPQFFAERRRTISIWTDVTATIERQKAITLMDAQLEQRVEERTAELTQTVTELDAFNYSVSHDLRSPARAIHAMVDTLLEDWEGRDDQASVQLLERVRDAATRMDGVIDALMQLAAVARIEPERSSVDLSAIARAELELIARADPARSVRTRVADGVVAEGDGPLIAIVLHNLIGNAWKFTQHTAEPLIEFGTSSSGAETAFFVRDNGVGFDTAESDRLFVPFQRLRSAETFDGSGVGLATVHRIVTRHGGRVWADALPGVGATFCFTLPPAS